MGEQDEYPADHEADIIEDPKEKPRKTGRKPKKATQKQQAAKSLSFRASDSWQGIPAIRVTMLSAPALV